MESPDGANPLLKSYLLDQAPIRQIDTHLYSVMPPDRMGSSYDSKAAAYDRLVSSNFYLKLAWGVTGKDISHFMSPAFEAGEGCLVDLAAGTSVDAVAGYLTTQRPIFVVDLSVAMLQQGMRRVSAAAGGIPDHLVFLQADALHLPFLPGSIHTILCHGALHLLPDCEQSLSHWHSLVVPGGQLFASSLIKGRWLGNAYLGMLHRAGEVSAPRTAPEFFELVSARWGEPDHTKVVGNFAFGTFSKGAAD